MTDSELTKALEKTAALIQGSHIVYTSGRHGSAYVNKDALYPHTELTSAICREMAFRFEKEKVDVVLAPAIGGVILSQWVAHHLTQFNGREVLAVYAEKSADGESFLIKRGYDRLVHGKRILILEDILTTGISVKRVVEAVRAISGNIVGVSALCNRGGISAEELGNIPRLESLVSLDLTSWEASECPLCANQTPINLEVGKGREFLAQLNSKR